MSVPAFVMKIFEPFTTHSPSRSSARVRVAPASEPAPGSVRPNAAERAARGEIGEPLALLLLGAEEEDRHRPERRVRGDRDRDRGVDPGQLLDRDRVGERVAAGAAVLLRDRDAHEPELGEPGDELVGEAVLAVELLGDRGDPLLGELADGARAGARARRRGRGSCRRSLPDRASRARARRAAGRRSRSRPCRCSSRRGRGRGRPCRRCRGAPRGRRRRTACEEARRRRIGAGLRRSDEFFRSANVGVDVALVARRGAACARRGRRSPPPRRATLRAPVLVVAEEPGVEVAERDHDRRR